VEFDRVVPPAGNLQLTGRQLGLGPARSGQVVRFWADTDLIHLFIGGTLIKTVRAHLTVTDLARLVAAGAVAAGPSPLPPNPATPSRSSGSSPAPALSSWAATSSWPRRSSVGAAWGSASNATP